MNIQKALVLTACIAMTGSWSPAQQAPASGPVIRTESNLVLVDAVATDNKGNYVRDLTAKDFKVFEDDKEQAITSFNFGADPATRNKHYVILFFDNTNLDVNDQPRARRAATQYLDANADEDRAIAVVNYSGTLQVTQNFTGNVERLKQAVTGARTGAFGADNDAPGGSALTQAAANFGTRNVFLALRNLAQNLRTVPGRKTLVYFSAGFQIKMNEHGAEYNAALDACNQANVAVYSLDARGLVATALSVPPTSPAAVSPAPASSARNGGLRAGLLRLALSGVTPATPTAFAFQGPGRGGAPVGGSSPSWADPRTQAHLEIPDLPSNLTSLDVLFALATGTGGFVIKNTNDLTGGLDKISKEQAEYYLLGYVPPESKEDSCHKLRVRVERKGVSVRSRSGYCNARRQDLLTDAPAVKQLETLVSGSGSGTPASEVAVQVPYFYSAPNVARVNLAMNIPLNQLKAEKQKGKLHAEVNLLGIAYRADNGVAARFSDLIKIDFDNQKRLDAFTSRPLYYENQFDIGPGSYTLKLAYSTGGDGTGKVEVPLTVEPYDPGKFALSSLALSMNYIKVTDPRANLEAAWIGGRTPLVAMGMRFTPLAAHRFKATDPVVVYAEIYEPVLLDADKSKQLGVGAAIKIVDRKTGKEMADTGVMRAPFPEIAGNPVMPVASNLPIASLAPGAYRMEMEAGDTAGNAMKRTADFDIE